MIGIGFSLYAQQLPRYSEYMFDKAIINPAYAGTIPYINTTLAHRQQFVGIEGAPVTQFFVFHAPIQKKNIGLGFKIINDKAAVVANLSMEGMFSYYLGLGSGRLSFGIEAGILNQKIDFTDLIRHDAIDNTITYDRQNKIIPDASFGIFYQTKTWFLGWTSFQLAGSKIILKPMIQKSECFVRGLDQYRFQLLNSLPGKLVLPGSCAN